MFAGLFLLLIVLAILVGTIGAWSVVIILWEHKLIRYIALIPAVAGIWTMVSFLTHDPNTSDAALAWQGRYAIRNCMSGPVLDSSWTGPMLIVATDQVCLLQDSLTDNAPVIGRWNHENTKDRTSLELQFPGYASVQVTGTPEEFSTHTPFPISDCR